MKKASSSIDDSSDVSSSDDNEDNGDDDSMGDGENDLQDEDDDSGVSSSEKEERSGISESDADVDAPTIVPAIIARINAPERDYHILEQDERARLLTTQGDLVVIISVINNSNKMLGYPPVWQKQVRSKRAYFHCGCSKDCFKVNLCTTKVASGGNKRKSSEIWKIHSIGERVCEPMEPFTTARLNTFIPKVVKANLVTLFDLGIGASAAHLQALHFAQMQNIRTSWEESDVKNFFDTLTRLYGEDIILVLEMLSEAGNFVKVDVKTQRNGKRHLNRFFAVDSTMKELFLLFGSFATLDSTFGKNWMQIPMQFFVGVTNENVIVPFATCATRSETKADYLWIMEAFYECYNTLPPVMNVDGDVSISDAIDATALAHHLEVDVGLCRHHHFGNVADRIVAIIPGTDLDQLKVDYNSALGSSSEEMFEERFKLFTGKYDGNNLLLRTYLVAHFYDLRTRLVLVWTGNRFCANFGSTGIGEAFHSLLASGTSSSNTLSDVLKKVDAITVKQIQANKKNASKWEIDLAALSENDLGGFVLASVCTLLSGSSFHVLMGRNVQSMFHSVHGVSVADDMGLQSWKVKDRRFSDGVEHLVTERLWGDESGSTYSLIKRNLSVDMDLGKGKCASCHETKHPVGVSGFNLPNRWEFLYPTNSSRKRVIVALGFGQPKEEGSSNNATSDGLLDTLQKYDYYLEENLEKGLGLRDAKVDTMEQMRKEEYGGQVLGKPRITADCWVQCGLLEGEETLPESERRTYCGKWYHLECFGLHRTPTKNERIPCLQCLQVVFLVHIYLSTNLCIYIFMYRRVLSTFYLSLYVCII